MKTVKLRIPVVVDAKGRWSACGWNKPAEPIDNQISLADNNLYRDGDDLSTIELPTTVFIIEATVEVPYVKPKVVQGGSYVVKRASEK